MLKIILFLYISTYGATAQQNQALPAEVQEALRFSHEIEKNLIEFVYDAVPLAAQKDAQKIVDEAKAGVAKCESALERADQIWQYKTCSSAILRDSMLALTKLVSDTHSSVFNAAASWCWLTSAWLCLIMLIVLY